MRRPGQVRHVIRKPGRMSFPVEDQDVLGGGWERGQGRRDGLEARHPGWTRRRECDRARDEEESQEGEDVERSVDSSSKHVRTVVFPAEVGRMCGRYALDVTGPEIAAAFTEILDATSGPGIQWVARWNVAPTQSAPVIRRSENGPVVVETLRWGLVPSWTGEVSIGSRMINARAETIHQKLAYRTSFRHRRCLVPIRAFFEWSRIGDRKIPHAVRGTDGDLLLLAGIWARTELVPESPLETFAIVTTRPHEAFTAIHDRMPVVLDGEDRRTWLDHRVPEAGGPSIERLRELLVPCREDRLAWYPVSNRVNRPDIDDPTLLAKADPTPMDPPGLFDDRA